MIPQHVTEGSFFCLKCGREYEKSGRCKCKGEIVFISETDSRYLKLVMASSRKVPYLQKIAYVRPFIKNRQSKEEIRWL